MHVISASRRTDIPAFYTEWFMNRVRSGFVRWPNAYGGKPYEASLRPQDVSVIVFWSKNYGPLVSHLEELDAAGYGMCFHYTITGLPRIFEPSVPEVEVSAGIAKTLSERYGSRALLWRYDPILISSITDASYHRSRFKQLASMMAGLTERCYISFPTFYGKVVRNAQLLQQTARVECLDPTLDEKVELAQQMADIAASNGIRLQSCCGDYLVADDIEKAHCIDEQLLRQLYPNRMTQTKPRPTRKECGCFESKDIGAYDTCIHGCVYCYANASKDAAAKKHARHDATCDMITGDSGIEPVERRVVDRPTIEQPQLDLW